MPEPVFRSSEGYDPRVRFRDLQADIPTEPGFRDEDEGADIAVPAAATPVAAKPRGGCAKALLSVVGIVGLIIALVAALIIYLAFFYRGTDTSF